MSDSLLNTEVISFGKFHPENVTVSIDTIRASTLKEVDEDLVRRLRLRSKPVRPYGRVLNFYDETQSIFFHQRKDGIVVFELSLSSFSTSSEVFEYLEEQLGPWALSACIQFCDLNVNFPYPIKDIFHGLDFGRRRSCERWGSRGTGETFYIGCHGNRWELKIYDKRKESRARKKKNQVPLKHPCTRIEIMTLPKKNMKMRELSLLVDFKPFKNVTRYNVTLIRPEMKIDESTRGYLRRLGRFHEFKARYEDWGLYIARRKIAIETERNFHSQYGEFFTRQQLEPSLDDIFQEGIRGFFQQ